ncbi:MAG: chromate efflux transporter [Gemmatimonas sp.]|jgi:chromate transporter|uniref:chromate efflux transporter n=1 Tax=Gemmatimonas sp. TaxID=1962908 RepID=UPI00391F3996|nr:chromate efflux transporter [Gemmatimonadota bacterium]
MAASHSLREVARVFLTLGTTAFGGPAAHVAAMEDELVTRRRWIGRDEFADLVGAANLIPGPNSTELAIHLGYRRAGWAGLLVAGSCFIVPAVVLVWLFAMAYVQFGTRVEVAAMLQGMQPAVLAVVVQAIWRLKGSLVRSRLGLAMAMVAFGGAMAGVSELLLLLVAIGVALAWAVWGASGGNASTHGGMAPPLLLAAPGTLPVVASGPALGVAGIFTSFLKIGGVLIGSGYVLLAFLRGEFVERLGVLSEAQLLDAIAIGQVTPGPVFSAATFIGYILAGHAGAAAATAGIFLPAFVAVALTAPLVRQLRRSTIASRALDAVNAVSLALMAAVVVLMARGIALDVPSLAILLGASLLLLRTSVGAGWVLLGGALAGLVHLL